MKIRVLFFCIIVLATFLENNGICSQDYFIASYYFPGWDANGQNVKKYGYKWTGWEQLKSAKPRFMGHKQPKVPLWGYENEADPIVMSKKISTAHEYGVDAFIFDWYFNDEGPYLNGALDNGFLNAPNNNLVKFAIMWTNHKVGGNPAEVTPDTFDKIIYNLTHKYFKHPSYWKIDGNPKFLIYDIDTFINNFGGIEGANRTLNKLRTKTKEMGFKDLHLSVTEYGLRRMPPKNANQLLLQLKINSIDSYAWVQRTKMPNFPTTNYELMLSLASKQWEYSAKTYQVPFNPNVMVGWDPSPRAPTNTEWKEKEYPFTPVLTDNTPTAFRKALVKAKEHVDSTNNINKIITINAWNEWAEGSYLEPDTIYKYAYLQSIKEVFGSNLVKKTPK